MKQDRLEEYSEGGLNCSGLEEILYNSVNKNLCCYENEKL